MALIAADRQSGPADWAQLEFARARMTTALMTIALMIAVQ
jgi:hypothetical protein